MSAAIQGLTLYGYWRSSCSWRVRIALAHKGVEHAYRPVNLVRDGGEQLRDEYRAKNPMAQVPLLEFEQGGAVRRVSQSVAIIELLEDLFPAPPLLPADPYLRARARQLELRADEVFFPQIYKLFGLQDDMQGAAAQAACAACHAIYGQLETLLADREYLAGPYSYADIGFYMACVFADRKGAGMRPDTPRLLRCRRSSLVSRLSEASFTLPRYRVLPYIPVSGQRSDVGCLGALQAGPDCCFSVVEALPAPVDMA